MEQGMQFDQAEFGSDGAQKFACGFCRMPLASSYYQINGHPACEACRYKVEAEMAAGPGMGRFFKAALAGLGAAVLGAGIYYAVLAFSGYEVGIVAIVVGFLVGRAVRWGSNGRGGRGYQILAVFLTYFAIVSTYIPIMIKEYMKENPAGTEQAAKAPAGEAAPASATSAATPEETAEMGVGGFLLGVGALLLLAAALPFLAGIENILGIVIIGIGLWEAWRINRRLVLEVSGPFEVGKLAQPQPAPEPAA